MTINNTWALQRTRPQLQVGTGSDARLVEVASRGGNFLLNVGPQPDGMIQPEVPGTLRAIGDWIANQWRVHLRTTFGPIQGESGYRTTGDGSHLFSISSIGHRTVQVAVSSQKVLSARLLCEQSTTDFHQAESGSLQITLPPQAPDKYVRVHRFETLERADRLLP